MAKLLGIDVGTTSAKVVLIDEHGRVLKQASAEYPLSSPQPLWSEQNPNDWWAAVEKCIAEIADRPDAIGITGQMHGAVFLDANDQVVRPAILWNDQRTHEESEEIDAVIGVDRLRRITCNPPLTGFQLPKIVWLRNHELSNYLRVRRVLLPKDYIRFRLTGALAGEVSDASGTGLLNVSERRWAYELMTDLELDHSWFPSLTESAVVSAQTNGSAGLQPGIPVVGGAGDQAAGAVATGAVAAGVVSVSLGTSGVVFTSLDEPRYAESGATHTFCHANGSWHAMGVTLACGGSVKWLRDTVFQGVPFSEVVRCAEQAPPGSSGLTFLPYLSGERCPHPDPFAKGVWAGLTMTHRREHLARSVFEGISFSLGEALEALRELGAQPNQVRVTGGGAKSDFWVAMLSDVFGVGCVRLVADEGPALGAAVLAGVGTGVWASLDDAVAETVRIKDEIGGTGTDYSAELSRYQALYPATKEWSRK